MILSVHRLMNTMCPIHSTFNSPLADIVNVLYDVPQDFWASNSSAPNNHHEKQYDWNFSWFKHSIMNICINNVIPIQNLFILQTVGFFFKQNKVWCHKKTVINSDNSYQPLYGSNTPTKSWESHGKDERKQIRHLAVKLHLLYSRILIS